MHLLHEPSTQDGAQEACEVDACLSLLAEMEAAARKAETSGNADVDNDAARLARRDEFGPTVHSYNVALRALKAAGRYPDSL